MIVKESLYEHKNTYFKGPSKERILDSIKNLSLEKKFELALENDAYWLIEQCLDNGVDPSLFNNRAIRFASYDGKYDLCLRLLKDPRVDPSALGNEAIWWAYEHNHSNVLKELLKDTRVKNKLNRQQLIKILSIF